MNPCRACHAPLLWVRTESGRPIPLDPEPVEYGGNVVIRDNVAIVLKKGEPSLAGEARYQSHFATCKAAKQFMKAKKAAEEKAAKETPDLF
jgi:hypothetical protein